MNNRKRTLAVLSYEPYDRLPLLHFGFWGETLEKWADEGHITLDEAKTWEDGNIADKSISAKLGFDGNYYSVFAPSAGLFPPFEEKVVGERPDGSQEVLTGNGAIVLKRTGATGIPAEVDHILKGRKEWEELYLPKLQYSEERFNQAKVYIDNKPVRFDEGGKEFLQKDTRDYLFGLHCGSLFGVIRDWLGLTNISYLYVDDESLYDEIIDTVADLSFRLTKTVLETGAKFDFAHFWEDICFKNGPLVIPSVFDAKVGPHYKRITDLLHTYGINIVSLDCDGLIDALIPTWIASGVNTMFPIEVGTWNASIAPWREKYGKELRGVGGMRKYAFAQDFAAVDAEVERLKPLVELGGYIPCPDHRISPDATWDNVRYYCDKMRTVFG